MTKESAINNDKGQPVLFIERIFMHACIPSVEMGVREMFHRLDAEGAKIN